MTNAMFPIMTLLLLLGGDAGEGRTGLRPDSITVASIDLAVSAASGEMTSREITRLSPPRTVFPSGPETFV